MTVRYLVLTQACSQNVMELCATLAVELGPTSLYTGTAFDGAGVNHPGLEIVKGPTYDNRSYRSRARTWAAYIAGASAWLARQRGPAVMVVSTNPPMLPHLAWAVGRARRWPYVVRVLDVYPDVLWRSGVLTEKHPVARAWAALNRRAFGGAAAVISLGDVMSEVVTRYMPRGRQPVLIPSWVDASSLIPRPKNENWFAKEHGQTDKLTVLYSGNLGLTHDLSGLSKAAQALESDGRIHFMFIGGGAQRPHLQTLSERLANVSLLPFQPHDVVPYSMATGDVALITLGKGTEGISMPSKCYYMMAAGCAILGVTYGDNDVVRTIQDTSCGVSVRADDAAGIQRAIERFRDDPEFLAACRRNARQAAEQRFSKEQGVGAYLKLLRNLDI